VADTITTSWTDLLYELRGPLQTAYPRDHVLLAEFQRNTSRKNFSGNQVRVPIFSAPLQGAHGLAEGGNITAPQVDDTAQAHVKMAHMALPISLSPELMAQTEDNAAAKAVGNKVKRAREAMARGANERLNGNGDALLGQVASGSGSPGLTIPIAAGTSAIAAAAARQLYKGRIIDVRTRSTGADPGQGLKRKIAQITKNADGTVATVVLSTTGFGGGSGNVTFSANEGIYILDTYGAACQGIIQIGALTGTFEDIDKAANDYWQGTDGRNGATTFVDPDLTVLDGGILTLGERSDLERVDFITGDPGVILNYQQAFYNQMRFQPTRGKLDTGFEGPVYAGMTMIGDFDHERFALTGITKESLQAYGYAQGPDWDNLTGSMWQRFGTATARNRNVEAWLVDDFQFGAHECRTMVRWRQLNRAS
jgi:hypothetical protein